MTSLETIKDALLSATKNVGHYSGMGMVPPYVVWAEDSADDIPAGGRHNQRCWMGTADLYTKNENDPLQTGIEQAFSDAGISWALNSVQYEDDTGYIHYEWIWALDEEE